MRLVEEILGKGHRLRNGEVAFFCPECRHYKRKLQVNFNTYVYHCWTCDFKGRSLFSLFKRLRATTDQISEMSTIVPSGRLYTTDDMSIADDVQLSLPSGFRPLWETSGLHPERKHAQLYLKRRGVLPEDIMRYNIGYCETGHFAGMVIIPSYDSDGQLNFFTGRAYRPGGFTHVNPAVSKNIVGFELHTTFQPDVPLVIVEGVFDAMAVRRNAVPLFGKYLLGQLRSKILTSGVKQVYVALDADATKDSLDIVFELRKYNIDARVVDVPKGQDPGSYKFNKMAELIAQTQQLTMKKVMQYKMGGL